MDIHKIRFIRKKKKKKEKTNWGKKRPWGMKTRHKYTKFPWLNKT